MSNIGETHMSKPPAAAALLIGNRVFIGFKPKDDKIGAMKRRPKIHGGKPSRGWCCCSASAC
jgi:hypothetical protein